MGLEQSGPFLLGGNMLIIMPARKQEAKEEQTERKTATTSADEMREEIMRQTVKYYGTPPKVVKGADVKGHGEKFDWAIVQNRPKDWRFMEESRKVLSNLPETWTAYADNEGGRLAIIEMEYKELMNAQGAEARSKELVHLASACLHLWRLYNVQ